GLLSRERRHDGVVDLDDIERDLVARPRLRDNVAPERIPGARGHRENRQSGAQNRMSNRQATAPPTLRGAKPSILSDGMKGLSSRRALLRLIPPRGRMRRARRRAARR